MFEIDFDASGNIVVTGRLDAAHAGAAQEFLDKINDQCVIDLKELEYISSAGLGVLLKTHKRLVASGEAVKLINVNSHINDIFKYSGFDRLFEISLLD